MAVSHYDSSEYGLPNPETKDEVARLEMQHRLWLNSLNALFITPVPDNVAHVLDIGCGPAFWTRDFALKYPSAIVHGLDLNPPSAIPNLPSNTTFHKGNAEDPSVLPSLRPAGTDGFDFIFGRCLTLGIHSWPAHLARCYSILRPGGWIESQETTMRFYVLDPLPPGHTRDHFQEWIDRLGAGTRALGFDAELAEPGHMDRYFGDAGFVNFSERTHVVWRFGGSARHPWETEAEKKQAEYGKETYLAFLKATTDRVLPGVEGYSLEEARKLLAEVLEDFEGPEARRCSINLAVRIAQKPEK